MSNYQEELKGVVEKYQGMQAIKAKLEAELQLLQDAIADIETNVLVNSFDAGGITKITIDGYDLQLANDLSVSWPKLNEKTKDVALTQEKIDIRIAFLKKHNLSGVVKTQATTDIHIEDDVKKEEFIKELTAFMQQHEQQAFLAESVHASTLKKTVRELFEDGVEDALEVFEAYQRRFVSIKPTKEKTKGK